MPSWPGTLPQYVLETGYEERSADQTIETQVDAGLAKIRRRFTGDVRRFNLSIAMTAAQYSIFNDFRLNTLGGGALSFDWVHPITRAATTFRFRKPAPSVRSQGSGQVMIVTFVIETVL